MPDAKLVAESIHHFASLDRVSTSVPPTKKSSMAHLFHTCRKNVDAVRLLSVLPLKVYHLSTRLEWSALFT